jgi:glycosyltransferase involved in cell wall biosynthesis
MKRTVAIVWHGLPNYAARAIRAGLDEYRGAATIVGTCPVVPITGMEEVIGQPIIWLDPLSHPTWRSLGVDVPQFLLVSGWATPAFNHLAGEVRAAGGEVIGMVDNSWKGTPRQLAGALFFRFYHKRLFSSLWVPGKSGRKLCQFLGMKKERVHEGLYVSDPSVFSSDKPLSHRAKRVLFVGQFIERKGLHVLLPAWRLLRSKHPDWVLTVVGDGPLRQKLETEPGIEVLPFLQPSEVAVLMRDARFLILPSLVEHWGLVVNEAALCGCALLCATSVGASWDLANEDNSVLFRPGSVRSCHQALAQAVAKSDEWLDGAEKTSLRLASPFTVQRWGEQFNELVSRSGSPLTGDCA